MSFLALLLLGLIFSPLGGLTAFIITYQEYVHHFPDKKVAFWKSIETGIVSCLAIGLIYFLAVLFLWKVIVKG